MCHPALAVIGGIAGGYLASSMMSEQPKDIAPPAAPDLPTLQMPDAEQAMRSQEQALQETEAQAKSFRERRRRTVLAQGGSNPTVLTSPLGVSGSTPTATKTLLGQ